MQVSPIDVTAISDLYLIACAPLPKITTPAPTTTTVPATTTLVTTSDCVHAVSPLPNEYVC